MIFYYFDNELTFRCFKSPAIESDHCTLSMQTYHETSSSRCTFYLSFLPTILFPFWNSFSYIAWFAGLNLIMISSLESCCFYRLKNISCFFLSASFCSFMKFEISNFSHFKKSYQSIENYYFVFKIYSTQFFQTEENFHFRMILFSF